MKILFFLALLTNLVFFLWQYHVGAFNHAVNETEIVNPEPKQIWLVSELKNKPPVSVPVTQLTAPATVITQAKTNNPQHLVTSTVLNPPQTPVPTVTTPAKTLYCYQITGFANKTTAAQWAKQQTVDLSTLQIKETAPVVADYLVNYPPAATFSESKKNIAFLEQHGIRDFFMINQGEFKGAISLGVFRNETRAIKAQQAFMQKGVNAKVSKRYKTPPATFLELKSEKNKQQLLEALAAHTSKPSVELLSKCD
jgi:hypothetical protein